MDPVSLGLAIGGLGLKAFGTFGGMGATKKAFQSQEEQIRIQMQQDELRRQMMNLDAQRKQKENMRNVMKMQHLARNNAASQGGLFGSGYAGGQAQIQGAGNWNALGISQAQQAGNEMFNLMGKLNQAKMSELSAKQDMAFYQGLSDLGGSLIQSIGPMKQLTGLQSPGSQAGPNLNLPIPSFGW